MSRPSRAAAALIDDAREQIAECLHLPKPSGNTWAEAGRDVDRAARAVGRGVRVAMDSVDSELAERDA